MTLTGAVVTVLSSAAVFAQGGVTIAAALIGAAAAVFTLLLLWRTELNTVQTEALETKEKSPSTENKSTSSSSSSERTQSSSTGGKTQSSSTGGKTQSSSTGEKTQLSSTRGKTQLSSTRRKTQLSSTRRKTQSSSTGEKPQLSSTGRKIQSSSLTGEKTQSSLTEERHRDASCEVLQKSKFESIGILDRRGPNPQDKENEIEHLLQRLHLNYQKKLTPLEVLQITRLSLQSCESCSEKKLISMFLQQLLMMNYRSRYIHISNTRTHTQHHQTKTSPDTSEDMRDFFTAMTQMNKVTLDSVSVHPMDVQMAVFHCADVFLQQLMMAKLSQCQYALPLLIPHPVTRQIQFPLWSLRRIYKSWKTNTSGEIISQNQPIYKSQTPMVFFFRLGSESAERYSKSQIINSLINEKHNTFFHRNCPGSISTRRLMDGVVEIAWFCPSAKKTDHFTDCIAFCNLHGDAGDSLRQLEILSQASSVNVLLLTQPQEKDRNSVFINKLFSDTKPLICLFTSDTSSFMETIKGKFKIGLKNRNQSDVSEELRKVINECLSTDKTTMFRVEDLTKRPSIRVDEDQVDECRSGKDAAESMMKILKNKSLTEVKESFLPCQGKLWHQWSEKNKELHRPQTTDLEIENSIKQSEMKKIRKLQTECSTSKFIQSFIKIMKADTNNKTFFLTWLGILMDDYTSADLLKLQMEYNTKWSTLKEKSDNLPDKQAELEKISQQLQAATFGMEHIMREIGQIYESCTSLKKRKKDLPCNFSQLPKFAAEIMASGFPLELMDGDAAHVPITWISAVLDALTQRLGDQRLFVLSVLGIQSSGKSTMLNAMFGLQFSVSAGRCTRGAFMQLVPVSDEMKTQLKTDYILVVDTEGLRALELSGRQMRNHDNELATFVVGIGNLTLINIFGENPAEMQDILQIIVQAFLRMKEVRLSPSCLFVHQNVSDVTAGDKNTEGRRRLLETLDEMTKLCANEGALNAETFSDVIGFDIRHDVKYFAQLWEGSPPLAPPNPSYCENIQQLKTTILNRLPESQKIMLSDLKSRINDLWKALLNEGFIFSFRNTLEISAYRKLETKYSQWSWDLRSAMMEAESKLYNKIENEVIHKVEETDLYQDLDKTRVAVEKSMSEFFEKDKDKDLLIQWKASFEIKIKELQQSIVKSTMKKLQEILQQREVKKNIDSQRTQHENALFEKSKKLALKFKHKATDNKTLKVEFDLFWNESVKTIIRDTPKITDIDVIRDVRQILRENYSGQTRVEQLKNKKTDLLAVRSFTKYVVFTQSTEKGVKGALINLYTRIVMSLSVQDEGQIHSLVTDIKHEKEKMIQSWNISKIGYNSSFMQQIIRHIQTRVDKFQTHVSNYKFTDEFFIDLVLTITNDINKTITEQFQKFREANDPVKYIEEKKSKYYNVFQKYCEGATSTAIVGEIVCQKLKEPIAQSVYKKTARELADEVRSNCPSLSGNRTNLEKHILTNLAIVESFTEYMSYIEDPRDHVTDFIQKTFEQYIVKNFKHCVLPKLKNNIHSLQQKIITAAQQSSEEMSENNGDVSLWLKIFTEKISEVVVFSENDLSGVNIEDVENICLLKDVIKKDLSAVISEISSRFTVNYFKEKLQLQDQPDEILINHLCQCCWAQCPFCGVICTNTIENHDEDHNAPFHRVNGVKGWHFRRTTNLSVNICTSVVASNKSFHPNSSEESVPYNNYRSAGEPYSSWNISPDLSELPYWKWFVCRFQKELESHHEMTFENSGKIPKEWKDISKNDAVSSLKKYFK